MLRAMKEQLLMLANDDNGQFHAELRQRVGKRATALLEKRLKRIVTLMPDFVTRTYFYWDRSSSHSQTKKLGGYLLTYLYEPKDFLSQEKWGLLGYLDDAYFAAKVYTTVIEEELQAGRSVAALDMDFAEEARFLKRHVRAVIPREAEKIDQMIEGLKTGSDRTFLEAFATH